MTLLQLKVNGSLWTNLLEVNNQMVDNKSNQDHQSGLKPDEITEDSDYMTLPAYPNKLKELVTENRAEELKMALEYLQDRNILFIGGVGGVGKTTFASALVEMRQNSIPLPFWFDFNTNRDTTLGDVLEKLADYLNTPDIAKFKNERRDAGQKDIDRLIFKLQNSEPVWLVFDNLENILDGTYFHDRDIDSLFTSLRRSKHNARIIITSRLLPSLRNGESLIDIVSEKKLELKSLPINLAVDYLKKNGFNRVKPEKLEELAKGVDGHPLALKLLVELVKKIGLEDTLNDLSMFQKRKEDTIKKVRRLFDKLAGDEKELLERISVFRRHESLEAIKHMFTDKTSDDALEKLLDKSLLDTDHRGAYWLHPLVLEFAYNDLKDKIEVHKRAYEYYLSLPLPDKRTKKEDVQTLIEAHHHACMSKEYDKAADLIFENNLHEDLDRWGNYGVLIELYGGVLPKDHFKDKPLLRDIRIHSAVIGNLGQAYRDLGQTKKAIEYYERALVIAKEIGNRRNESITLGNLGNAHSDLGQIEKAIEYNKKALAISGEIGDRRNESITLGNLGIAYSALGQVEEAIEYNKKALAIAREIGDRRNEITNLGNLGNAYNALGQVKKAIEYSEQALAIAREIRDRRNESTTLGNLGNAYKALGQVEKAIEYYENALAISREIGDRRGEGNRLGNLGLVYSDLGQIEKAIEYYENALAISREIGDRRGEGAFFGNLGLVYSYLGQMEKATEYYERAFVIAKEMGDSRGEGVNLVNIGIAYSNLGQVDKAIEYYEKGLGIARESGDREGEGSALEKLGIAYSALGQVDKAIEYYEKAMVIARESGDRRGEGVWLGNLGIAYSALGLVDKAIEYYEQTLGIYQEIRDRRGEGNALGNLGIAYSALGQVDKAIKYYEKAMRIARESGDRRGEGNQLGNLGTASYSLGQVDKAIRYYEQALVILREIGDRRGEGTGLGNLGIAYSALGQVDKAIRYYGSALGIAREIGDRRSEGNILNNLGFAFIIVNKYKEALACHLLAKDRYAEIKDPNIRTAESNLDDLKDKLGEKEFEKLLAEVAPRAEEIIMKILEGTSK